MQSSALCISVDSSIRGRCMEYLICYFSNHSTPSDSSNFALVSAVIPADCLHFWFYKARRVCSCWWGKDSKVSVIFIPNHDALPLGQNWKALKYLHSRRKRMTDSPGTFSTEHAVAERTDVQLHRSLDHHFTAHRGNGWRRRATKQLCWD